MPYPEIRTKHRIVAGVEAELLKRLRRHDGLSRTELARELGLATSTAGIYVDRLIHEGFVQETGKVERPFGRRPRVLRPNPTAGRFVGVDFEPHGLATTVVDFSLQVVRQTRLGLRAAGSADWILESIRAGMAGEASPLLGVGIGVPGVIDAERGTASGTGFLKGWRDVPVVDRLRAALGVPIHLENNIRAMAMAELWLGHGRSRRNFACFGVRTGIGVGVVLNGELFRGRRGGAGEIGRWPAFGGPDCSDTLEAAASLDRILKECSIASGRELSLAALKVAAQAGDRNVREVLERAAAIQATAISQLHMLLDLDCVVIVGPLAELGAALVSPLWRNLRSGCDGALPQIEVSDFGHFGGALGAAALAVHGWKPARGSSSG